MTILFETEEYKYIVLPWFTGDCDCNNYGIPFRKIKKI